MTIQKIMLNQTGIGSIYRAPFNVPAWKNRVILRAGERYRHRMVPRFSVELGPLMSSVTD